jgi:hypothetical protein
MSASRLPRPPHSAFPAPFAARWRRRALPEAPPFFLEPETEAPPAGQPAQPVPDSSALTEEWQRIRRSAGGALLVLCFALFGWQIWRGRAPAPVVVESPIPVAAQSAGGELRVQVSGAVVTPGVYRLTPGDRVEDAVRAAGGFAAGADTARVNLAQRVRDEHLTLVGVAPRSARRTARVQLSAERTATMSPPPEC